ncbi:hypothetical protein BASA61_000781 [Batrachochytrium salamandrivorans]|nr:hypothetical protein BASA61_000781 [Batrachochytrium salamandrivorans]
MFCLQEWPSARTHPVRSRIAHTKICAKAKGISPHKILESLRSRLDLVPDTLDRSSALSFDCAFSGQTPSIASGQFLSAFRAVHSNVNRLTKKQKHANRVADKQDLELQTALALSASVKTHHDKQQRLMLQYGGCTVIPSSSSAGPGHRSKRVLVMSKLLAAEEAQMKMESRARAILHASTSSSLDTSQDPCSLKTAHHSLQFQSVSRDSWLETRTHGIRSSDSDEIQIDTPPAVGAEGPGSLLWYAARGNLPVRDIPLMASYKSRVDPNLCILDATATVSDECSNSVDISQPDLLSKSTPPKASLTAFPMEGVQKTPQKKHSEPVEPLTTNAALSISEHDSLCSNEEESELSLIMKAYNADIADKRREADVEKEAIEIAFQTWANLRKKEMESKVAWATRERLVSTKDKLPIRDPPIIGFKTHISLSVDSCTNTLVCSNNESSTENELDDIHLSFSHNTREIPMGIPADGSPSFATATDPCSGVLNNDNSVVEVLEMESPVFYSSAFLEWNGGSEPEFLPLKPHTTSEPTDLIEICSTDTDDEIDDSLDATNSYVFVQPIKTRQNPSSHSRTLNSPTRPLPLTMSQSVPAASGSRATFPLVIRESGSFSALSSTAINTTSGTSNRSTTSDFASATAALSNALHTVRESSMDGSSSPERDNLDVNFTSPQLKLPAVEKYHKIISNYITNDAALHQQVLLFEPLDFDLLFDNIIQQRELRFCTRKVLASFLDKHGICFKSPAMTSLTKHRKRIRPHD